MDKILVVCAARAERGTLRLRLFSARAFYAYGAGFTKLSIATLVSVHSAHCLSTHCKNIQGYHIARTNALLEIVDRSLCSVERHSPVVASQC